MGQFSRDEILERLQTSVTVADGAMGTMLYAKGVYINRCYDELNLAQPELVRDVHGEYLAAGADLLETNTFGANRFKLAVHGLEGRVREIARRGAELAREVAGRRALVGGSIGPLGKALDPRRLSPDEMRLAFADQIEGLLEGGADLLVIETQNNLTEALLAVRAARRLAPEVPLVVQATFAEEGRTLGDQEPEDVAIALVAAGVEVVGANCSQGPSDMLDTVTRMAGAGASCVSAQPNAGAPKLVDNRFLYLTSPEYVAEYARRFIDAGVSVVGGCCGTTPAHIRAIRAMVKMLRPHRATVAVGPLRRDPGAAGAAGAIEAPGGAGAIEAPGGALGPGGPGGAEPAVPGGAEPAAPALRPAAEKSRLGALLGRRFVTCVELSPPQGLDTRRAIAAARALAAAGVDAVNIPDGPRATARMSPLALSQLLRDGADEGAATAAPPIETIVHYTCRDRNLLGMQADLLGAWALGQRNVLAITGDPPKLGDYPSLTAVYDVDAIGLVGMIAGLNGGRDLAGRPIGAPTAFLVGVGANPGAPDLDRELRRLEAKVAAGAEYVMTQPVYEPRLLERFLEAARPFRVPVLVGILPLASYRNAEFLHNEVPGMQIPEAVRERMRRAPPASAGEVGVQIAREALDATRHLVEGVYVMPPLGRWHLALQVLGAQPEPATA